MMGHPRSAKAVDTVDFPLEMPPVTAKRCIIVIRKTSLHRGRRFRILLVLQYSAAVTEKTKDDGDRLLRLSAGYGVSNSASLHDGLACELYHLTFSWPVGVCVIWNSGWTRS